MRGARFVWTVWMLAAAPVAAESWQTQVTSAGGGDATAVAVDRLGDVVAAGGLWSRSRRRGGLSAVKLARCSGKVLWRRRLAGTTSAVAVDARTDVFQAGSTRGRGRRTDTDFAVIKRSGRDGTLVWRYTIDGGVRITSILGASAGSRDHAFDLALDGRHDVIAGGVLDQGEGTRAVVVKLGGRDGRQLWRSLIASVPLRKGSAIAAVAVDGAGDATAAGVVTGVPTVLKLDGDDGHELWRHEPSGATSVELLALDAAGDAVAAGLALGAPGTEVLVVKLAGTDGTERWRRTIGSADGPSVPRAMIVDAAGDVVVSSRTSNAASEARDSVVAKLSGSDGTERWRLVRGGSEPEEMRALAAEGTTRLAAAGVTVVDQLRRFTVLQLDPQTGAVRDLLGLGVGVAAALTFDPRSGAIVAGGQGMGDEFTVARSAVDEAGRPCLAQRP